MRAFTKPYGYGRNVQLSMSLGNFDSFVKPSDPCLKKPSRDIPTPLKAEGQETVSKMLGVMQHKDCPLTLDSLSAPMLGIQHKVVLFSMKLRNSHMRNVVENSNWGYDNKSIVMVNPSVTPEPHSGESWQYECNFLHGKKCGDFQLVHRTDFV